MLYWGERKSFASEKLDGFVFLNGKYHFKECSLIDCHFIDSVVVFDNCSFYDGHLIDCTVQNIGVVNYTNVNDVKGFHNTYTVGK